MSPGKNKKGIKGGHGGGSWMAPRMEGVVKNRGIKNTKKRREE